MTSAMGPRSAGFSARTKHSVITSQHARPEGAITATCLTRSDVPATRGSSPAWPIQRPIARRRSDLQFSCGWRLVRRRFAQAPAPVGFPS
jgi:hypothetical protein